MKCGHLSEVVYYSYSKKKKKFAWNFRFFQVSLDANNFNLQNHAPETGTIVINLISVRNYIVVA